MAEINETKQPECRDLDIEHLNQTRSVNLKAPAPINELAAALAKAQGQFDHAKKDVNNAFFKSKYADLASVIDAAKKPLSQNGLSVVQTTDFSEAGLVLITTLLHSSGQSISGRYPICPIKNDPQAYGSAITYARRYMFSAITGIAADDDDGNEASNNAVSKQKPNAPETYSDEAFQRNMASWKALIEIGKKTPDSIINAIESKAPLTEAQKTEIKSWKGE